MKAKQLWLALWTAARRASIVALAERDARFSAIPPLAGRNRGHAVQTPETQIKSKAWRLSLVFFVLCFVAVAGVNALFAYALSRSVSQEALEREADQTAKNIANMAEMEGIQAGLTGGRLTIGQILDDRLDPEAYGADPEQVGMARAQMYAHMMWLPDAARVNILGKDRVIVWSSDPARIGHRNDPNLSLDKLFATRKAVTDGYWNAERDEQKESLGHWHHGFFVESYVPLFDAAGEVATIIEVYREPNSIVAHVQEYHRLVWFGTALVTIIVCLAVFAIMRSFDRLVTLQQQRRIDNDRLILVGEMSAAVAHGLRSPMAAIRSSAELALENDPPAARNNARDIIFRVDQLSGWLRELLTFSQPVSPGAEGEAEAVDVRRALDEALRHFHPQFERSGVRLECAVGAGSLPPVAGNGKLVLQVLNSVIANAVEAMPRGGLLKVAGEAAGRRVRLVIGDTGVGMNAQQLERLFRPFQTTKRNGLGLGMTLSKRIMEGCGGSIQVRSRENEGTEVELNFEAAG